MRVVDCISLLLAMRFDQWSQQTHTVEVTHVILFWTLSRFHLTKSRSTSTAKESPMRRSTAASQRIRTESSCLYRRKALAGPWSRLTLLPLPSPCSRAFWDQGQRTSRSSLTSLGHVVLACLELKRFGLLPRESRGTSVSR